MDKWDGGNRAEDMLNMHTYFRDFINLENFSSLFIGIYVTLAHHHDAIFFKNPTLTLSRSLAICLYLTSRHARLFVSHTLVMRIKSRKYPADATHNYDTVIVDGNNMFQKTWRRHPFNHHYGLWTKRTERDSVRRRGEKEENVKILSVV
jgi:hypothetical protein